MFFLTRFLVFLANFYILGYVYLLEINKCDTSQDWRRDYIFYYSMAYIFTVSLLFIYPQIFLNNPIFSLSLKIVMGLLLLVNIYCLYTYPEKLEQEDCDSAHKFGRDFMKIFSYFYILIMILMFIYLMVYYLNKEYFKIRKLDNGYRKLSQDNLEKIKIISKVDMN